MNARISHAKDRYAQLNLTDEIALMIRTLKRPRANGDMCKIQCAYFGFPNHEEARVFLLWATRRFGRAILRQGERLGSCEFEVKVWPGQVGREAELLDIAKKLAKPPAQSHLI